MLIINRQFQMVLLLHQAIRFLNLWCTYEILTHLIVC